MSPPLDPPRAGEVAGQPVVSVGTERRDRASGPSAETERRVRASGPSGAEYRNALLTRPEAETATHDSSS